jgi:hypothetical protein
MSSSTEIPIELVNSDTSAGREVEAIELPSRAPSADNENSREIENTTVSNENQEQSTTRRSSKTQQLFWKLLSWLNMVLLSVFIFTIVYEVLLSQKPTLGLIDTSGSKGNVIVTILSQIFVQLIGSLIMSSFEILAYQLAARPQGTSIPTFLQLSPATTYFGSLSLTRLCGNHLIWGGQR